MEEVRLVLIEEKDPLPRRTTIGVIFYAGEEERQINRLSQTLHFTFNDCHTCRDENSVTLEVDSFVYLYTSPSKIHSNFLGIKAGMQKGPKKVLHHEP